MFSLGDGSAGNGICATGAAMTAGKCDLDLVASWSITDGGMNSMVLEDGSSIVVSAAKIFESRFYTF